MPETSLVTFHGNSPQTAPQRHPEKSWYTLPWMYMAMTATWTSLAELPIWPWTTLLALSTLTFSTKDWQQWVWLHTTQSHITITKHRKRHYILHTFHSMKCIHPCSTMQHTFQACSFRQQHLPHPCIGCFPLLPTIPEGSVWHWHYTWATQKTPIQTYQYRPTTDAINPVLQQVITMTNNPQPLNCIISATFPPNQPPTVLPTHASPTFCHHTRLPTIAELAGTSMDAQLPIQYCIVRVRCNNSLTLP